MGLFNIIGGVVGAAVKIAASPVAIAADVIEVATGNEPKNTKNLISSIDRDATEVVDELTGENL